MEISTNGKMINGFRDQDVQKMLELVQLEKYGLSVAQKDMEDTGFINGMEVAGQEHKVEQQIFLLTGTVIHLSQIVMEMFFGAKL